MEDSDWVLAYIAVKCELPGDKTLTAMKTFVKSEMVRYHGLKVTSQAMDLDSPFEPYLDSELLETGLLLRESLKMVAKFSRTLIGNIEKLRGLKALKDFATETVIGKIKELASQIEVIPIPNGMSRAEGGKIYILRSDLLNGDGATYLALCHEFGHIVDFGLRKVDGGTEFLAAVYPKYDTKTAQIIDLERFADAFGACLFTAIHKETTYVLQSAQNAYEGNLGSGYYPRGDERIGIVADSIGRASMPV